jgi:SMI1-KNR4 cell-wall
MNLTQAIRELRELNETVPIPRRLPTLQEVEEAERELGMQFPADYRRFLLEASDVVYGTVEPAVVIPDSGYLNLVEMANEAWDEMELPRNLLPICQDNGDYYCINAQGEIVYWSHNGTTDEKWRDLATWIDEVWIQEE